MRNTLLFSLIALLLVFPVYGQITVTASDMPVNHDTLRYSSADPLSFNFNSDDTGANKTWDFAQLTPILQGVDTYRKASEVNVTYGFTISSSAFGTKIADSIPNIGSILPVEIKDIYNFYDEKNNPSRFIVAAYAANISGLPLPANYSDPDEWYYFPLNYGNQDTSTFAVNISLPTLGGLKMEGTRTTIADGWGQMTTPFFTQPVPVLRVKTTSVETDSINFNGVSFGIPRTTVEYKFLSNGDHYPVLWVTANVIAGNETITSVRYRDEFRSLGIHNPTSTNRLTCYPKPVNKGILHIQIPETWNRYQIAIYDQAGRLVLSATNRKELDFSRLPAGNYVLQAVSNEGIAYDLITN